MAEGWGGIVRVMPLPEPYERELLDASLKHLGAGPAVTEWRSITGDGWSHRFEVDVASVGKLRLFLKCTRLGDTYDEAAFEGFPSLVSELDAALRHATRGVVRMPRILEQTRFMINSVEWGARLYEFVRDDKRKHPEAKAAVVRSKLAPLASAMGQIGTHGLLWSECTAKHIMDEGPTFCLVDPERLLRAGDPQFPTIESRPPTRFTRGRWGPPGIEHAFMLAAVAQGTPPEPHAFEAWVDEALTNRDLGATSYDLLNCTDVLGASGLLTAESEEVWGINERLLRRPSRLPEVVLRLRSPFWRERMRGLDALELGSEARTAMPPAVLLELVGEAERMLSPLAAYADSPSPPELPKMGLLQRSLATERALEIDLSVHDERQLAGPALRARMEEAKVRVQELETQVRTLRGPADARESELEALRTERDLLSHRLRDLELDGHRQDDRLHHLEAERDAAVASSAREDHRRGAVWVLGVCCLLLIGLVVVQHSRGGEPQVKVFADAGRPLPAKVVAVEPQPTQRGAVPEPENEAAKPAEPVPAAKPAKPVPAAKPVKKPVAKTPRKPKKRPPRRVRKSPTKGDAAAKKLMEQGAAAFKAGDYPRAQALLQRAYDTARSPDAKGQVAVWMARTAARSSGPPRK